MSGPNVDVRRPLLELDRVDVYYGAIQALHQVSLRVEHGEIVTMIGANGAGKSTTIRTISGLVRPRAGRVQFDGADIGSVEPHKLVARGICQSPEGRRIFPNLTVRENLAAFAGNRSGAGDPWTLERVFELFPRLAERASNMGNQLSGGEQQMLAIGRALMTNPRLLILDEATEGLAPLIAKEIWRIIRTIRASGIATVIVDKNYGAVMNLADRSVVIVKGRVVFAGTPNELSDNEELMHRFLGV